MPIYEPDLSYEDMDKVAGGFQCATCGAGLTVAWSGPKNSYMLRCGQVLEHEGIKPLGRDPWKTEIMARLRGGFDQMETKALQKLSPEQMLERINKGKFPKDLTPQDKQLMATIALEYGFDPFFGELMIYQGNPYVRINGLRRHAQESEELEGIESWPATKEERAARGVPDDDYLWKVFVWRRGSTHPFVGWGHVRAAEVERARKQADAHGRQADALPLVNDPNLMAEKRGETAGLRKGFHIPLPSAEDIIDAEFTVLGVEKPPTTKAAPPAKAQATKPRAENKNPMTDAQRRKISSDAGQMGYSELAMAALLKTEFNVESMDDLTVPMASKLIDMILAGKGLPGPQP